MVASQRGSAPWRKKRSAPERPSVEIIASPALADIAPNIETAAGVARTRPIGDPSKRWDFGHGHVPARRHQNPDGSSGGWVAMSAHVEPTVHVDPDARVYDNARVFDDARVLNQATIAGNARVYGGTIADRSEVAGHATVRGANIRDHAVVAGHAHIWEGATISGRASVKGQARVMHRAKVEGDTAVVGDSWVREADPTSS